MSKQVNQANREFGQKIRECRRRLGLTIVEAARQMQVQRTSLSRWENGHEMPRGEGMTKLRDHLRIPIGTNESIEADYQLLLPFDFERFAVELRIEPQRADTVQFQVRLKDIAS